MLIRRNWEHSVWVIQVFYSVLIRRNWEHSVWVIQVFHSVLIRRRWEHLMWVIQVFGSVNSGETGNIQCGLYRYFTLIW